MRTVLRGALALLLVACSSNSSTSEPGPGTGGTSSSGGTTPAAEPGSEIGTGDGTASSVTLTEIHTLTKTEIAEPEPVDLAFNPADPGELWVVGYGDNATHVGYIDGDVGWKRYLDPAARHFMHRPTAISMGGNGFWGTCGDNDNGQNEGLEGTDGNGNQFMGPALFTTDRTIFAKRVTGLGSHYDMLHSTPFCKGIAWEVDNVYWAFNGTSGAIDKYNFNKDHGPGEDDHSDGEIYRYADGQVKAGADNVVSHLVFDDTDKMLYVADSGNSRIVKLDTTKGTKGDPLPKNEILKGSAMMDGTSVEEVVAPGTLTTPSGIELKGELLYVTDTATSTFHVFKKDGTEVRKLSTDLPPGSLAGFTFGADGKIWFVDRKGGRVMRIDPK